MKRINKTDTLNRVKLTANILFSGIGCQERGFENSGLFDLEVLNTSDINKDAVVSYAAVHCGLTKEMVENYSDYPSREEMAAYLKVINLGYEPEKNKSYDWDKLARRKSNDIEKYWLACKLSNNLGDISKIEKLPYADLWTCSFPCTDISLAGKMKGLSPSDSTRSSLLWENIRLLKMAKDDGTLPKYIMFENVKNLVGKKFINDFNNLLSVLDELGFNSYWKVLNAKNCGVPQNRERVFVISIRKDIDNGEFVFPKPFDTGIRLKDILDENVDEKYYLSEKIIKGFQKHNENHKNKGTGFIWKPKTDEDIANTLRANGSLCPTDNSIKESGIKIAGSLNPTKTVQDRVRVLDVEGCSQSLRATDYKDPVKILQGIDKSVNDTQMIEFANCITAREDRGVSNRKSEGTAVLEIPNECVQEGNLSGGKWDKIYESARRYYSVNGCSPTIHTCNGGNTEPKISEPQITHSEWKKQMYDRFIEDSEGEVSGCVTNQSKSFGYRPPMKGYSKCLKAESNDTGVVCNYRIRKLTPNECWKLMGLTEIDCAKAVAIGGSDSQLYKQAGNGIVTNCCELLAEHLYKAQYDGTYVCTDENFINPQSK